MTVIRNMRRWILSSLINWRDPSSLSLLQQRTLMWLSFPRLWPSHLMAKPANRWAVVRNANQVEIRKLLFFSTAWKETFNLSKTHLFTHSAPSFNTGLECSPKRLAFQVSFYKNPGYHHASPGVTGEIYGTLETFLISVYYNSRFCSCHETTNSDSGPEKKKSGGSNA